MVMASLGLNDSTMNGPAPTGFRLNAPAVRKIAISADGERHEVELSLVPDVEEFEIRQEFLHVAQGLFTVSEGRTWRFAPYRYEAGSHAHAADGAILAPMPGKVIAVDVAPGEAVTKGQRLLVLEAMKMEHALTAPFDGTVTELDVAEGQQVQVEALLAKVEKRET